MADTISGITTLNGTPTEARVTVIDTGDNSVAATALSDSGDGTFAFTGLGTGTYELLVMVDGKKPTVDGPWALIAELAISGTLPDMGVGVAYSESLTISGGVSPYTIVGTPTLPAGVSAIISGSSIDITGTPTTEDADFDWSISIKDSVDEPASASGTVAIAAASAGLAPDEIANLTMWLDFTDSTTVFSDTPGTTPATPGGAIRSVTNKADSELWIKQNGPSAIWAEDAVGTYEALETYLDEDCYFQCANASYRNMDSYMSTSAGSLAFLVKMTGYNSTSTNYQAPSCGFLNGSGSYGIVYSTSNNAVHVIGNSGSSLGSVATSQGDFHVIQLRHNGTNRQIRVDNGSWSNLGDGTVNWLNTKLIIGVYTPFSGDDGKLVMLHAVAYSSAISDSDADDLRDWLLAHLP